MSKIYILSFYNEYGAEDVKATTDKTKVIDLIKSYNLKTTEEETKAIQLLSKDETSVNGENLSSGWGGLMLHIVDCA